MKRAIRADFTRLTFATLVIAWACAVGATAQQNWYVDDDAPNDPGPGDPTISDPKENGSPEHPFDAIQEAIDAALDNDTVLVADGEYTGIGNRDMSFGGKPLLVRSENGPQACTIDCQRAGRAFDVAASNGLIRIEGFKIQRGFEATGAALLISDGADALIRRCSLEDCAARQDGGAVYCIEASLTIEACTFRLNNAVGNGGAIFMFQSGASISGSTFEENSSDSGGAVNTIASQCAFRACGFQRNSARNGGAIMTSGNSQVIEDCLIADNRASNSQSVAQGGGILCSEGAPQIVHCTVIRNTVDSAGAAGGGIFLASGDPVVRDCVIAENSATGILPVGGGLRCATLGTARVTGCKISGNRSDDRAGGVWAGAGDMLIKDCLIEDNSAEFGGAIVTTRAAVILDCVLRGNFAGSQGGGIYVDTGTTRVVNTTVQANFAGDDGGGIARLNIADVINCNILDNIAGTGFGGGVWCLSIGTLTNCNIRGNVAPHGSQIAVTAGRLDASHCNVSDGQTGVSVSRNAILNWLEGNIDERPGFAFDDDVHLIASSAGIDAGTNTVPGGLPAADPDGNQRALDGGSGEALPDIGVYEFNPGVPSLALSARKLQFSTQVEGANPPVQQLSLRNAGGAILDWRVVGNAPWLEVSPTSGQSDGRADRLVLRVDARGLAHGAFHTLLEIVDENAVNNPQQVEVFLSVNGMFSVPSSYPTIQAAIDATIIDGDVILLADGTYTGEGNRDLVLSGRHVVLKSEGGRDRCVIDCENEARAINVGPGEGIELEGISIVNGVAINPSDGGGIRCVDGVVRIGDCAFRDCVAGNFGGGAIKGIRAELEVLNSVFEGSGGNTILASGTVTMMSCSVTQNQGPRGGALSLGGVVEVVDCEISDNNNGLSVGGLSNVRNCVFRRNSGSSPGGAIAIFGVAQLSGCTFEENRSMGQDGGAVYNVGRATIQDCVFLGNEALNRRGGGVHSRSQLTSTIIRDCLFVRNHAGRGGAIGNEESTSIVSNCTLVDNISVRGAGVWLFRGTMAIANSILWENDGPQILVEGGLASVEFSDVSGGWPGVGNIDLDPRFVDRTNDDLRLLPDSPCIEAGDPAFVPASGETDIDGQTRVWDADGDDMAVVDMGIDEFGSFGFGDLNCDGAIDAFDVEPFIAALLDPASYDARWPECDFLLADVDGDGSVGAFDIEPFIDLLFP